MGKKTIARGKRGKRCEKRVLFKGKGANFSGGDLQKKRGKEG